MTGNRKSGRYILALIALLVIAGSVYLLRMRPNGVAEKTVPSPEFVLTTPPKDTLPMPDGTQWLADSTRLFLIKAAKVTPAKNYPIQRRIKLDGDVFFEVPAGQKPFIINTKLLTLSITGKAAFLVIAPWKEEWAEIQVISGTIIAKKAYPSEFNEPDTLRGNQMLMINRTIDLMEKEKFDATDLKAWRVKLP